MQDVELREDGRWTVVVEDEEADADLVAVEAVVVLDADDARPRIEVRLGESALAAHQEHERHEQPRDVAAITNTPDRPVPA